MSIRDKTLAWFVQLPTNTFQGLFKDKLQFSRTKIYLIKRQSLTPIDHPIGLNSPLSHLQFLPLRPALNTLFYTTFRNKTLQNE